jgi:hypothetical protein
MFIQQQVDFRSVSHVWIHISDEASEGEDVCFVGDGVGRWFLFGCFLFVSIELTLT